MFSSRRDWWAHETEVHRWEVTWLCTHCPKVFKEQSQFDSHLHTINEGQPAHSSATKMPAASKKYSAQNFKEQVCPICFDFTGNTSLSFAKHVGKHMEEIALAVISHVAEDDDARDSERFSDLGSEQESDCGNEQNVRSFLECAEVGAFDEDLSPLSETNTSPSDQKVCSKAKISVSISLICSRNLSFFGNNKHLQNSQNTSLQLHLIFLRPKSSPQSVKRVWCTIIEITLLATARYEQIRIDIITVALIVHQRFRPTRCSRSTSCPRTLGHSFAPSNVMAAKPRLAARTNGSGISTFSIFT